jgi:hypothetical protein
LLDAVAVDYFDYDYFDDYRYRRVEKLASKKSFQPTAEANWRWVSSFKPPPESLQR